MRNKVISILILASLIAPSFSQALILLPTANLTIVVNTQGGDSNFIFDLSDGEQFNLQTDNLTASQIVSVIAFGSQYSLSQESVAGLKINSINCVSDNQNDNISYGTDYVLFSPTIDENITCTFGNIKSEGKTPVLIVPGLIGTDLVKGSELLWADVPRMVTNFGDAFMDPLAFTKSLTSTDPDVYASNVIRSEKVSGITVFDYTEKLISDLTSQGYVENTNLFTFPYDWRYGVTGRYADGKTNVDLLKQKIADIKAQTGAEKVDVVAHSMGGLITKKYVVDNPISHSIGKAVFVGVPNTGAPKSVKVLLQGDNFDVAGLSDAEIKKISENFPAAYDLLPSQQYYNTKGSFVTVVDRGNLTGSGSVSIKDLNYNETKSFLTSDHQLNAVAMNFAEGLHTQDFDNFDMRNTGVNLYAVDGCKTPTLSNITETRATNIFGQKIIEYKNVKWAPGDKTVPLESSTNLPIDQDHKFYSLNASHGTMMTQDGSRQQIINIISGSNLSPGKNITQDITKCQLNGKAISVFSPVDIFVTDQDGKKLGLAEDGSIFNEIINADFQIWGDPASPADRHKFLYLPTDEGQTYTITMDGTGTGTYTIKIDDIQNSNVVKTQEFRDLPVTADLTGVVNFGAQKDFLTVKQNTVSQPETIFSSPPEVVISFDTAKKDLTFSSPQKNVTIVDSDNTITLTDQVGNKTEITLKEKDRKKRMSAEIKSLKYNGVAQDISKNSMMYAWNVDKAGNFKKIIQHVKSKKEYNILAEFDGKNTNIIGKDVIGKIKKTVAGLKIISITTDKGDFNWSY